VAHVYNKLDKYRLHRYTLLPITSYKTVPSPQGLHIEVWHNCKFLGVSKLILWLRVQTTSIYRFPVINGLMHFVEMLLIALQYHTMFLKKKHNICCRFLIMFFFFEICLSFYVMLMSKKLKHRETALCISYETFHRTS
jgi:hypothetical protein